MRLPGIRRVRNVEVSLVFPHVELLQRQPLAGPLDAIAIVEAIGRPVRPTDQVRAIVAQELARAAIERHRKVLAQIAVGHDDAALVAKEQRNDRKTVCVLTKPRRANHAAPELVLTADPNFQRAQSFPGSA